MALAPVIAGPRLLLRPFVRADISAEYLSWLNDPERMRFSRQRARHHDATSSAAYLDGFEGKPNYFWAVEERGPARVVGTMTAFLDGPTTDVGILIGASGQGFGREAWGLALDHLLRVEGRSKVTGGSAAGHVVMRRIFERWGMVLEEGTTPGIVRYGMTRAAWMENAPLVRSR
jgi:RimJ/RimL family protein N-acetyltransferase